MTQVRTRLARTSKGFSLIELMVALSLGLIVILAVSTVFSSILETSRTRQQLDHAQEAVRFASHTIMRVVQQGVIQRPDAAQELRVDISPGPGRADCLGNPLVAGTQPTTNTFFMDAGRLQCRVGTNQPVTLVTGVDATRTTFTYFNHANAPVAVTDANWQNVRSVRVLLVMQSGAGAIGPSARFSATMRCGALGLC